MVVQFIDGQSLQREGRVIQTDPSDARGDRARVSRLTQQLREAADVGLIFLGKRKGMGKGGHGAGELRLEFRSRAFKFLLDGWPGKAAQDRMGDGVGSKLEAAAVQLPDLTPCQAFTPGWRG